MYFPIQRRLTITLCNRAFLASEFRVAQTVFIRDIHRNRMDSDMAGTSCSLPSIKVSLSDAGKMLRIDNITKSQQDNRDYRGLQLANGLKVLLVSDPSTDKSAAAMTVDIGHMSDPDNVPGLAHFCEHMLFLGTKKYPNENAYSTYLTENGGTSNASTYADNTKYYFDVAHDKLDGALDRFAQFFIAPLFTDSATDREINAVNSEHEKNLAIDVWRIRQVNKALADQTHPFSKFGTGNVKTLSEDPKLNGINVRDELLKFYEQWYSANIMCLAVYGKENLDDLEQMVVPRFSEIVNKNVTAPRWTDHPFLPEHYATKVSILPVKDSRSLALTFLIGDLDKYYKAGPEAYLSHLIGHEGKGSILSELKRRGWSNNLLAGHTTSGRGFGFFDITVDLTQEGLENVDEISKIIFQYISMLRTDGPKKWIFEEYLDLSEMQFRFKDKETALLLASSVVHSMQLYPMEEVLTAPYLITDWRPDLIDNMVNEYLLPEKCRVVVVGKKLEPICDQSEFWYGTKYHSEKLSDDVIQSWKHCGLNPNLHFPEQNLFIPTDFELCPAESDIKPHPSIVHDTPLMRVWFKQDAEFCKPKTIMNFDFNSPLAYADPLSCNLAHMFVTLYKDQLNEYLYDAELAGLRFGVANTSNGISLSISGYSHKQQVLLSKVIDQMFKFKFCIRRFEIIREQLRRSLRNFNAEQPYQHAVYYLALILTEHAWTKQELDDAVKLVTVERLKSYILDFLSRMHVECFIQGNVNKQQALDLSSIIEKKLQFTHALTLPLLAQQLLLKREYKLVQQESYRFVTENKYHKSSCAELYLQCGMQSDRANVFIDLAAQVLCEPCYNTLRTKEQLGYIVFCASRKANGAQGIRFIVQSAKHPAWVEERIELFLDSMEKQIEEMSDEEFNRHKEALATQKLEKPKRLSTQFNKYLLEISLQQYHFDRAEKEVAILQNVTKSELIDFYRNHILSTGENRTTLSIHVVSTAEGGVGHANSIEEHDLTAPEYGGVRKANASTIDDLSMFKSSKELYPMVQPYLDVKLKGAKSKL